MIKTKIRIRNLVADYPFSGDPKKTWFCEIIDSNLGVDGNPVVNYVANGKINLTCLPRQLNAELDVIFHEDSETQEVKDFETISAVASGLPNWAMRVMAKILTLSKKLAIAFLLLVVGSVGFAVISYYFDISAFLNVWQKFNAANGAKVVENTVKETVNRFSDPLFESEGVLYLEKKLGIDYKDTFIPIDDNRYLMRNVIVNEKGEPILMDYNDAEDKCEDLGGEIALLNTQKEAFDSGIFSRVNPWKNVPEWAKNSYGIMSDDRAINKKDGVIPNGGHNDGGLFWGDPEDVSIAARCVIFKSDFMEAE